MSQSLETSAARSRRTRVGPEIGPFAQLKHRLGCGGFDRRFSMDIYSPRSKGVVGGLAFDLLLRSGKAKYIALATCMSKVLNQASCVLHCQHASARPDVDDFGLQT